MLTPRPTKASTVKPATSGRLRFTARSIVQAASAGASHTVTVQASSGRRWAGVRMPSSPRTNVWNTRSARPPRRRQRSGAAATKPRRPMAARSAASSAGRRPLEDRGHRDQEDQHGQDEDDGQAVEHALHDQRGQRRPEPASPAAGHHVDAHDLAGPERQHVVTAMNVPTRQPASFNATLSRIAGPRSVIFHARRRDARKNPLHYVKRASTQRRRPPLGPGQTPGYAPNRTGRTSKSTSRCESPATASNGIRCLRPHGPPAPGRQLRWERQNRFGDPVRLS